MFYERLSHARKKDALIYDPCLLLIFLPEKAPLRFLYLDAPTLHSSIKTRLQAYLTNAYQAGKDVLCFMIRFQLKKAHLIFLYLGASISMKTRLTNVFNESLWHARKEML